MLGVYIKIQLLTRQEGRKETDHAGNRAVDRTRLSCPGGGWAKGTSRWLSVSFRWEVMRHGAWAVQMGGRGERHKELLKEAESSGFGDQLDVVTVS